MAMKMSIIFPISNGIEITSKSINLYLNGLTKLNNIPVLISGEIDNIDFKMLSTNMINEMYPRNYVDYRLDINYIFSKA